MPNSSLTYSPAWDSRHLCPAHCWWYFPTAWGCLPPTSTWSLFVAPPYNMYRLPFSPMRQVRRSPISSPRVATILFSLNGEADLFYRVCPPSHKTTPLGLWPSSSFNDSRCIFPSHGDHRAIVPSYPHSCWPARSSATMHVRTNSPASSVSPPSTHTGVFNMFLFIHKQPAANESIVMHPASTSVPLRTHKSIPTIAVTGVMNQQLPSPPLVPLSAFTTAVSRIIAEVMPARASAAWHSPTLCAV